MTQPPEPPDGGPAAPPVCPRHPDRVSYVRCQRCERPACPECQRQAAVGVHCVDCVREASRTAPQPRTAYGAPLRSATPVVTYVLIGLNVLSFLLQNAVGRAWEEVLIFAPFLGESEPWRFLSTAFLHSRDGFYHIAFNMLALWTVGQALEPAFGRARYVTLYLLSALGGSVAVLAFASPLDVSWGQGVVGASGAVFGLFGAVLVVLRRQRRSARSIVVLLVLNAALAFVFPRISWEAHLGGFLVGVALGLVFAHAPRERRRAWAVGGSVVVGVVLLAVAVLRYVLAA